MGTRTYGRAGATILYPFFVTTAYISTLGLRSISTCDHKIRVPWKYCFADRPRRHGYSLSPMRADNMSDLDFDAGL